jgi:outer membrane lipoprotein-sorting protein
MKKIISVIITFAFAVAAMAQTAEEILSKMEQVFDQHENDGVAMTVESKIPIIGTIRMRTCLLGNKTRMETKLMGRQLIIWDNGENEYTYDAKNKEVTITNVTESTTVDDSGDLEMFSGIADGYNVSIKKETAEAWYIQCQKSKDNTNEVDPGSMEVVVAKGTYFPISLSTKVEGVKLTMKDLTFGITEDQVTFDISQYPGVKINDKRNK